MKHTGADFRFFVIAGAFVFFCLSGCYTINAGDIITFDKSVSAFDKIRITDELSITNINRNNGKGIIRIHVSSEYRVSVTIDSKSNQYLEIKTENDLLQIKTFKRMAKDFIVDVYAPYIAGVSIAGAGLIEIIDAMVVPSLGIDISGAGKIEGTIVCDNLSAAITGAGKINITGKSTEAKIDISGTGTFSGNDFRINNASITISGVGRVNTWVADNLQAVISGMGNINYRGDPKIEFTQSGIGKIKPVLWYAPNAATGSPQ
jgi:hypothetical protein